MSDSEYLRVYFTYDPDNISFPLKRTNAHLDGRSKERPGQMHNSIPRIKVLGRWISVARAVWLFHYPDHPITQRQMFKHLNGNSQDNRIENIEPIHARTGVYPRVGGGSWYGQRCNGSNRLLTQDYPTKEEAEAALETLHKNYG